MILIRVVVVCNSLFKYLLFSSTVKLVEIKYVRAWVIYVFKYVMVSVYTKKDELY